MPPFQHERSAHELAIVLADGAGRRDWGITVGDVTARLADNGLTPRARL
jgi:hypothetical protein